jgi:hypothetical protein
LDNSLNKDFAIPKISESFRVQFRAEAFNILNHPSFQQPNATIFAGNPGPGAFGPGTALNASAGRITNTTSAPRQIQLGLKIVF